MKFSDHFADFDFTTDQKSFKTRLNMLFTPTMPARAEYSKYR